MKEIEEERILSWSMPFSEALKLSTGVKSLYDVLLRAAEGELSKNLKLRKPLPADRSVRIFTDGIKVHVRIGIPASFLEPENNSRKGKKK